MDISSKMRDSNYFREGLVELSIEGKKRRLRSQEEIQRLAKPFDVRRTNRFNKELIHFFEGVYQNYARILSNSLFLRFRIPMKLRLIQTNQMSYLDYVMGLPKTSVTTVYTLYPVKGPFCLSFDRQFSFLAIDSVLGGSFTNEAPDREFTDVEKGVLRIVSNAFVSPQDQCYQEYGQVNSAIRSIEFNPVLMQILADDESLLILEFTLEANEKEYPIKIAIPHSSVENIQEVLQLAKHQEDQTDAPTEESRQQLGQHLRKTKVEASVLLGTTELTVPQVESFEVGQLIKLNQKVGSLLDLKVENEVRFKVQPGASGQKMAVQVVEVVDSQY